ncbi:MAG: hypothetical protein AAFP19_20185 [Bacteroidota bacterium]
MLFQGFFRQPSSQSTHSSNKEVCINCWGYFQWDNGYSEPTVDLDKHIGSRDSFIRRFVKQYIGK